MSILSRRELIDLFRAGKLEEQQIIEMYGQEVMHWIKEHLMHEYYNTGLKYA